MAEKVDNQLLSQRLLDGDQYVLESILRAYGPGIAWWLRHKYVRLSREEIRDVLSTALWRLWEIRESYDPAKSSLRSFFRMLACHEAVDMLKSGWHSSRRHEVPLGEVEHRIAETVSTAPADLEPGDDEPSKIFCDLKTCMENLNESSRHVLWADALSKLNGVPSRILAQELNISESAVRVARKRGLDKLREAMKKLGY